MASFEWELVVPLLDLAFVDIEVDSYYNN